MIELITYNTKQLMVQCVSVFTEFEIITLKDPIPILLVRGLHRR